MKERLNNIFINRETYPRDNPYFLAMHPHNGIFDDHQTFLFQTSSRLYERTVRESVNKIHIQQLFKRREDIEKLLIEYRKIHGDPAQFADMLQRDVDVRSDIAVSLHATRNGTLTRENLSKLSEQLNRFELQQTSLRNKSVEIADNLHRIKSFYTNYITQDDNTYYLSTLPLNINEPNLNINNPVIPVDMIDRFPIPSIPLENLPLSLSNENPIGDILYKDDQLRLESWNLHQRLPTQ